MLIEQQKDQLKKKKAGFAASHYTVAGIAGLLGGFLLQGPDFALKSGASFSINAFIGYSLLSTAGILAVMRLNRNRE